MESNTTPVIRRYKTSDHESLMDFMRRTYSELGYEFSPNGRHSDIRDVEDAYLNNHGSFHVVDVNGKVQGCVGVRHFSKDIAELKRLYVAKAYRARGLGRALCLAAIHDTEELGYQFLRLDTTSRSVAALALFRKLGFHEIPRYNANQIAEIFMEKTIRNETR